MLPQELIEALTGRIIYGGGLEESHGMHLELDNGKILVIEGAFLIGLLDLEKETLQ